MAPHLHAHSGENIGEFRRTFWVVRMAELLHQGNERHTHAQLPVRVLSIFCNGSSASSGATLDWPNHARIAQILRSVFQFQLEPCRSWFVFFCVICWTAARGRERPFSVDVILEEWAGMLCRFHGWVVPRRKHGQREWLVLGRICERWVVMHRPPVSAKFAWGKSAVSIKTSLQHFSLNLACCFAHRGGVSWNEGVDMRCSSRDANTTPKMRESPATWSLMTWVEDDWSSPKLAVRSCS